MADNNKSGWTSQKGNISEGTMKKGGVNTPPTTNRPVKPRGQGSVSSESGAEKK